MKCADPAESGSQLQEKNEYGLGEAVKNKSRETELKTSLSKLCTGEMIGKRVK
jgi:hypothetical protein